MKILLSLALIFYLNINAQVKNIYSTEVEEYINTLKEYALEYEQIPTPADFSIGNQELDILMLKLYNAIASDPTGFKSYIDREILNQRAQIKSGTIDKNKTGIGDIHNLIRYKLENQYSQKFITLITTPYYLRVKIVGKTPGTYTTDTGYEYKQYIVKAEIEDVIKGEKKYKVGEQINFRYLKSDRCIRNYVVGNTYFIPFEVITTATSSFNGLTPQWFDCSGNYMISDEIISIPDDFFGFGNTISWSEFKSQFKNQFILQ